jgi:phosphodiesterase/alkaline phosphatase D-like protein
VYADLPFPVPFERAYRKLFTDAHYSRFFKEASRYAIYDDHELANNWDRGMELPLYREAMEVWTVLSLSLSFR